MDSDHPVRCLVVSDFNVENFVGLLANDAARPFVKAASAPFGQVAQVLMDAHHEIWSRRPEAAVIWTQPQDVIAGFKRLLEGERVTAEEILSEVDAHAALLARASEWVSYTLIPTWVVPARLRAGLAAMQPGTGIAHVLARMNLRLAEQLRARSNLYLLDAQPWVEAAGPRAFHPKLWHMAKVPFGPAVFEAAVQDVKAALRAITGQSRKLIVLDLDDTLWGGLVGEVGWEHLTLGGHDPVGEAFVEFQRALKALSRRGIALGVVSKNEERTALEAIAKHPEMVLRVDDLAGWRINWNDKAQNVVDLVSELNLGLQSAVFIDDSPIERARVRQALPEVVVPDWPSDPMLFATTVLSLPWFDTIRVSPEDAERTRMYATERRRAALKTQVGSADEWLATLGVVVTIEALNDANLGRAAQLLNKTNQMNLSTRRLAEAELAAWARRPHCALWTVQVTDRFGPSGLTGLISLEAEDGLARIADFVLSCRVMGRKVEEAMLATIVEHARRLGLREVVARFIPTSKNKPCFDFWARSGFRHDPATHTFSWEARQPYPFPDCLEVRNSR